MVWTCLSIIAIPHIDIGLDQQLTMSTDSYVYKYFWVSDLAESVAEIIPKLMWLLNL